MLYITFITIMVICVYVLGIGTGLMARVVKEWIDEKRAKIYKR